MRRLAFPIAAAALAGVAAGIVSAKAQPASGCYPPTMPPRHALRADVDGDGRADRVSVTASRMGDSGCRFTAVVAGGGGWSASRRFGPDRFGTTPPRLLVLAKIDGTRGAEIVIERSQAADQSFALLMTVRRRRLVPLPAPHNTFNAGGVFSFYNGNGAGGGSEEVDCGKPGTVVTAGFRLLSTTDPNATVTYYAERRTYRVVGTRFQQIAAVVLPSVDAGQAESIQLHRHDGNETRPFWNCAVTPFN